MQLDTIALPYDAVLALVTLLKLPGMPGFDITPMTSLSKPAFQARVQNGLDILQKRGFVTINQQTQEAIYDDRFGRLFLTALQHQPSVMVEIRQQGATRSTIFAGADGFVVEQSNPEDNPNLFVFTHLPTVSVIRSHYSALIEPLRRRPQMSASIRHNDVKIVPFQLMLDALNEGNLDEARTQLKKAKWDTNAIDAFLNDSRQARLWWVNGQDDSRKPPVFYYYIIETPTQCWLCQPTDASEKYISVEAVSGQRCADALAPMISVVEPHAAQA